jgi:two-component system, chemotaxis family, sensor kinase CheA
MLKGKKILLVDDDDRNIIALTAVLKLYKPDIITAHDGVECLEKLERHINIDLVLLDMMMPEMDGYETLKKIRASKTTDKIRP